MRVDSAEKTGSSRGFDWFYMVLGCVSFGIMGFSVLLWLWGWVADGPVFF